MVIEILLSSISSIPSGLRLWASAQGSSKLTNLEREYVECLQDISQLSRGIAAW